MGQNVLKGKIIKEESKIKMFQKGNVNGKWNEC
jgi:hypothetical protein